MSKVFELVMLSKCGDALSSSNNQFGFKKEHSTELCIFSLKEAVNYYNTKGSPVFMCFLNIKKLFIEFILVNCLTLSCPAMK